MVWEKLINYYIRNFFNDIIKMIYNLVSTESEEYKEHTIHYTDDKVFFECDYKKYSLHAKDNNIMMPNNILEEINKFLLDNEKIIYYNLVLSNVGSDIIDYNVMVSNYGNLIYLISTENYQYSNDFESVTMYLYKINDKLIANQEKLIYKIDKRGRKSTKSIMPLRIQSEMLWNVWK